MLFIERQRELLKDSSVLPFTRTSQYQVYRPKHDR